MVNVQTLRSSETVVSLRRESFQSSSRVNLDERRMGYVDEYAEVGIGKDVGRTNDIRRSYSQRGLGRRHVPSLGTAGEQAQKSRHESGSLGPNAEIHDFPVPLQVDDDDTRFDE